jgi:hypothetical protein
LDVTLTRRHPPEAAFSSFNSLAGLSIEAREVGLHSLEMH